MEWTFDMRSVADSLVIQTLAESEAQLREHNQSLQDDVASYRCVLVEALHALHHVTGERDRLRKQVCELLDERREAA
jgi:hypothetical protein